MRQPFLTIVYLLVFLIVKRTASAAPPEPTIHDPLSPPLSLTARDSELIAEPTVSPPPPPPPKQHQQQPSSEHLSSRGAKEHSFSVSTDNSGKTIIVNVTTIVITEDPDPNRVYHNGDLANQKGGNDIDGLNVESVAQQLEEDRKALKRLATILSAVGGVCVIAITVSIIIFTRMRAQKKRRLQEEALEEAVEFRRDSSSSPRSSPPPPTLPQRSRSLNHCALEAQEELLSTSSSNHSLYHLDMIRMVPEPSAPPAPFPIALNEDQPHENGRSIVSLALQSTPAPSAPSAKELDALHEQPSSHGKSSQSGTHAHSPNEACPHCELEPEIPPPAYSPSAPPLFALSAEPFLISTPPSLPRRRHSQG